ncbi:MAG TPA: PAS domain-containing protein, partial [Thermoguttaceae bacterium]|nr:PAS domain-containing protein [Thermoguttaceae bacterium]
MSQGIMGDRWARILLENLPQRIFYKDRDSVYVTCNENYAADLNTTIQAIEGKTDHDFYPDELAEKYRRDDQRVMTSGETEEFEETYSRDGKEFIVQTVKTPVADEEGQVTGLLGIFWDITERKRAEDDLAQSRGILQAAMDQSQAGIAIADAPDGRLRYVNDAGLLIRGETKEKIVDDIGIEQYVASWQVLHFDGTPLGDDEIPLTRALRYGETGSNEFIIRRADNDDRIVWVNAAPVIDDNGQITAGVAVFLDITERKRAEQERELLLESLEAKNAELERFAYTVSHDLKTPLITIKGFAGVLEEDIEMGDRKLFQKDLSRICNAVDVMYKLLDDVLELSRIGRLTNPPEEVPLAELAQEAKELVDGQLKQRNILVDIAPDLPVIFGDRVRWLEVMQNLIDNGAKYMGDQTEPRIEVGVRHDSEETVCFVRDNGIGIRVPYQQKVFGLFEQLNPKVEGSGVGLALVKRIVEIHGSRIWIESQGEG